MQLAATTKEAARPPAAPPLLWSPLHVLWIGWISEQSPQYLPGMSVWLDIMFLAIRASWSLADRAMRACAQVGSGESGWHSPPPGQQGGLGGRRLPTLCQNTFYAPLGTIIFFVTFNGYPVVPLPQPGDMWWGHCKCDHKKRKEARESRNVENQSKFCHLAVPNFDWFSTFSPSPKTNGFTL